jgi:hypothetical protein
MLVFGPSSKLFWKLRLVCSLLSKVKRGEPSDSELVLPSFLQDKNVLIIAMNEYCKYFRVMVITYFLNKIYRFLLFLKGKIMVYSLSFVKLYEIFVAFVA